MSHGLSAIASSQDSVLFRKTLTIPSGKVASNLTDFVTRVDLASFTDPGFWNYLSSDGGNLRVKNASNVIIPFEITWIDKASKTGELFFKSSLLSGSNNVFYFDVHGIGGLSLLPSTDTNGRNAVWVDYKAMVIPSADWRNSLSAVTDRTGVAGTPVLMGSVPPTLDANGINITTGVQSGDAGLRCPVASLSSTFTMAGRLRLTTNDNNGNNNPPRGGICYGNNGSGPTGMVALGPAQSVSGSWRLGDSGSTLAMTGISTAGKLNVPVRFHGLYDGSAGKSAYYDGAFNVSGTSNSQPATGDAFYLGTKFVGASVSGRFPGGVDYAYLRAGLLSANWIAAEYNSWVGTAFYTIT